MWLRRSIYNPAPSPTKHILPGNGTLGAFTFRELHADGPSPQPPANCTGPSFAVVSGAGVFRFQNGSLLIVTVVDGSGCVNLTARNAGITVNYEVTGGTGRFAGASGNLTMTATLVAVLRNASMQPALLTNTGEFEGTLVGASLKRNARTIGDSKRTSICSCRDRGNPPEFGARRCLQFRRAASRDAAFPDASPA